MTIAIFGATGQLGRDVLDHLVERGTSAADVLALGRNTERLAELTDRGFATAAVDLDQREGLVEVLRGVDQVLLVSTGTPGRRLPQHQTAVDAARAAGVSHLVYTSALQAPSTRLVLAPEHKATEEHITASGLVATFLRNGWYTENHQPDFASARQGVIANSIGAGRIASAPRREYAEAAAAVLTTPELQGRAYELSGDLAWDFTEFAATAQEVLGTPVVYQALTADQEREQLLGFGLDEPTVSFVGRLNDDIAHGVLALANGDLARLIGHPTEPLRDTLRTWV